MRRSVSLLFTFASRRLGFLLGSLIVLLGSTFCVQFPLPQRTTLPASLPLTETVPFRLEMLAADGNIICGVLVSALHPRSLGVVTDSFRPLVVESGDGPT